MERDLHTPGVYDFRQHDRVWQRVAPELEPYPGLRSGTAPAMAELPNTPSQSVPSPSPAPSSPPAQLPGAEPNPCCMGTEAAEMLEVLAGFIDDELADQRYYLAAARQSPVWARQSLRDMAADEGGHARRLLAVYYLITGSCYQPPISRERVCIGRWCTVLRERYHAEACGGFNYARAADGTPDPCLRRILNELSADEYRHAEQLTRMLERSLRD